MKKILTAIITMAVLLFGVSAYGTEPAATLFAANENGTITYESGVATDHAARLANGAYMSFNSGIVSQMTDFTISAWVKPDAVESWARVFDFGTGTTKYMFLTLTNGTDTVFAITTNGAGAEQKITTTAAFNANEWTHIAVTKSGNTGIIYVNGKEAGRNEEMTVSPSSLGSTDKNYIGKSQYPDPAFNGLIDDFRIYGSALSDSEIAALAVPDGDRIASAETVNVTTDMEVAPSLPETVTVTLTNGNKIPVNVKWDSYDETLLTNGGSFTVNGTIIGTDKTVNAIVTVNGLVIKPSIAENESGKVTATYNVVNKTDLKKAVIYLALYDGGRLSGVKINNVQDLRTGEYSLSADMSDLEEPMAKAFMWDSEMKPLADAVKYENNTPSGSSFEVSEVRLTDGVFKTSQDLGKTYIMSLDADKLLAPVAHSAGGESSTDYYGGWEAYKYRNFAGGHGITGHSLGHWLSAMSTMYAATGDSEVKAKLDDAIDKMAQYQATDGTGYVGGVEKGDLETTLKAGTVNAQKFELNGYWVPWYSFHKIYQGLIDAYKLGGNEKALNVVKGFADWAVDVTSNLTDAKFAQMLETEYGGMNDVMAQLYEITGEQKYLDLAVKFSQKSILEPLSSDIDRLDGLHANTQIPKIIGAAEVYEQDNSRTDYLEAAKFFYDTVVNNRSYVIGGNADYEHFSAMGTEPLSNQTLETCNTHNMLKLTEHLYSWNHKAQYMDYYEKALFNHILASQDPETGEKTYFMSTIPGQFKVYSDALNGHSFWCCTGSGMENPGRYTRNIYYKDGDSFFVNLFIASEVTWKEKGLKISQTTAFPYEDTTVIKIESGSADAKFKIRIPSWISDAATVTVNGESETVSNSGYYTIERTWQKGDTITVKLPMGLYTYTSRGSDKKTAFMYGPVVLAGTFGSDSYTTNGKDRNDNHTIIDTNKIAAVSVPDIVVEDKNPDTFITAKDISKLEFELTNLDGTKITLIPYADVHHERYTLYWTFYGRDEETEKDEFTAALDAVTTDTVNPYFQQSEIEHNMQKTSSSEAEYFSTAGKGWRDAKGEGEYFSYDMNIDPSAEHNYIMAVYWGSDGPFTKNNVSYTREFEIIADDTVVGEETLNNASPNSLVYKFYEIPSEAIAGKEKVTVKFQTKGANKAAGGVFEVRTTTGIVSE